MSLSTGTKIGIASLLAIPIFALGPPLLIMLFRLKWEPDFFYFALAGAALSLVLCVIAAAKASWWWLSSPLAGIVIVLAVYVVFKIGLQLFK